MVGDDQKKHAPVSRPDLIVRVLGAQTTKFFVRRKKQRMTASETT